MTDQEVFDFVVTQLCKQGCKSTDGCGRCMYRSNDGCRCAAGWMIPDDVYDPLMDDPSFDDNSWYSMVRRFESIEKLGLNFNLMVALQRAHDTSYDDHEGARYGFHESFLRNCEHVAAEFKFNTDILNKMKFQTRISGGHKCILKIKS